MAQPYVHEPMPSARSIRLISLAPSVTFDAPIQCSIITADLEDQQVKVPYEALSYVWGSPTGTIPIKCEGKELLVTLNCYNALRQLRFRFSTRILWIDAICIDQGRDDRAIQERNSQVQMMGVVYGSAWRVLVWLGSGDESTPRVFRLLKVIGLVDYYQDMYELPKFVTNPILERLAPRLRSESKKSKKYIQGLWSLVENQWFFRVWTMQEVIFARKCLIVCGGNKLDWDIFNSSVNYIDWSNHDKGTLYLATGRNLAHAVFQRRKNTASQSAEISSINRDKIPNSPRWAFDKLEAFMIRAVGHLQCSLPHDKVYGLYSMFKAASFDLPDVDYNKSVSEVYGDAAKGFIRMQDRSLHVLLVSIRPHGYDDFPTWVPNWKISHLPGINDFDDTGGFVFSGNRYHATKSSLASIPSFTPPHELQVRGMIVGRIRLVVGPSTAGECSASYERRAMMLDFVRACYDCIANLDSLMNVEMYQGEGQDLFSKTLLGALAFGKIDGLEHDGIDMESEVLRARFYAWIDTFLYPNCEIFTAKDLETVAQLDPSSVSYYKIIDGALDRDNIIAATDVLSEDAKSLLVAASWFHHKVCFELANWPFLFLNTHFLGRAYYNSRENDKVVLLAGSTVPFLLRDAGQNRYQVVGPAYFHGMMEGELWDEDESDVTDFILI